MHARARVSAYEKYEPSDQPRRSSRSCPTKKGRQRSALEILTSGLSPKVDTKPKRKPGDRWRSLLPRDINNHLAQRSIDKQRVLEELFFDVFETGRSAPAGRRSRAPPRERQVDTKKSPSALRLVHRGARSPKYADGPKYDDDDDDDDGLCDDFIDYFDNSDREHAGLGLVGRLFGSGPPKNPKWRPKRPFFTWWITVMQLLIFVIAVLMHGIAPIGVGFKTRTQEVLGSNQAIMTMSVQEKRNLFIGPRESDLIHLGAKFTPCMRNDENVRAEILLDRALENQTSCCVRNDGSGCLQSAEKDCQLALSDFLSWKSGNGPDGRTSGSVCGQDPRHCSRPVSAGANAWPDDLTRWPACTERGAATSTERHMTCELLGRPCCVGLVGECTLTTRDECDFRGGYFHQNATLCSHVDCMIDTCGMLRLGADGVPSQVYRVLTSQFLHAGVLTLIVTVLVQLTVMRDVERIIGVWRTAIIYLGSGCVGSLASAIFLPYHVESGPSGSQFGVLGALTVEVFRWQKDEHRFRALLKLTAIFLFLLIVGFLPMFDNWAHLFGFFTGLFLMVSIKPLRRMANVEWSASHRKFCSFVGVVLLLGVVVILLILFFVSPVYECELCTYFNCVPIYAGFCDGQTFDVRGKRG